MHSIDNIALNLVMYSFIIPIHHIKTDVPVIHCQKLLELGYETFIYFRVLIDSI